MKIKTYNGTVLYESEAKTIKEAVIEAVSKGISLKDADLRRLGNYSRRITIKNMNKMKKQNKKIDKPKIQEQFEKFIIEDRWEIWKDDGCIYDVFNKGEDIPFWLFELRDKLLNTNENLVIQFSNVFNYISPRDLEEIMEWLDDNHYLSISGQKFREEYWKMFIRQDDKDN